VTQPTYQIPGYDGPVSKDVYQIYMADKANHIGDTTKMVAQSSTRNSTSESEVRWEKV
jgi:hypothetical protein